MSFLAKNMFLTPLIARSAATFLDLIKEAHDTEAGLEIDTKFFDEAISFSPKHRVPLDQRDENGDPIIEYLEGLDAAFGHIKNVVFYHSPEGTLSQKCLVESDADSEEYVLHPLGAWRLSTRRTVNERVKHMLNRSGWTIIKDHVNVGSPQLYHLETSEYGPITRPNMYIGGSVDRRLHFIYSEQLGTYSQAWDVKVLSHDGDHAEDTTDALEQCCEDKDKDWISDAKVRRLYNGHSSESSSGKVSQEIDDELAELDGESDTEVYKQKSVRTLTEYFGGRTNIPDKRIPKNVAEI